MFLGVKLTKEKTGMAQHVYSLPFSFSLFWPCWIVWVWVFTWNSIHFTPTPLQFQKLNPLLSNCLTSVRSFIEFYFWNIHLITGYCRQSRLKREESLHEDKHERGSMSLNTYMSTYKNWFVFWETDLFDVVVVVLVDEMIINFREEASGGSCFRS